jgi:hypothetical protein
LSAAAYEPQVVAASELVVHQDVLTSQLPHTLANVKHTSSSSLSAAACKPQVVAASELVVHHDVLTSQLPHTLANAKHTGGGQ